MASAAAAAAAAAAGAAGGPPASFKLSHCIIGQASHRHCQWQCGALASATCTASQGGTASAGIGVNF